MRSTIRKSDSTIQQEVVAELAWDPYVSASEVGVQVNNGVVTLAGHVDDWAKVRAAGEAAHRVRGVLDVANELEVRVPGAAQRTDTDIAVAVRHALEWDVTVPDQQIQSTVSHGRVTLEGTVVNWAQRMDAERAVERLAGVKSVSNRIAVRPVEKLDPAKVHAAVENALERQAAQEASRIDVKVSDDTVDVTGIVRTWREKAAVLGAVRGTGGVRDISDHLRVEPWT
jgi:osmotically-inducible protein OsmY